MKAVIGIGVPGCGKTTILKPLAEREGLTYINADDIREELTGDPKNHTQEEVVWRIARERIKQGLHESGVVIDATHSKRRDRISMIRFCKQNGATKVVGYWIKAPFELCQERNKARDRNVPDEVMQNMFRRLEFAPPKLAEGFHELRIIRQH